MLHICLACGVDSGTADGRVLGSGAIGGRELLSTDRLVVKSVRLFYSLVTFRTAQPERRKHDIEMLFFYAFHFILASFSKTSLSFAAVWDTIAPFLCRGRFATAG